MYLFAFRITPESTASLAWLPQRPTSVSYANMVTIKLNIQIANVAPMATRPDLFSEDVSIEAEEGEDDESEDDALGLSREVVPRSVLDVGLCGCAVCAVVEESVSDKVWVAERVAKMLLTMVLPSLAVDVDTDKSDSDRLDGDPVSGEFDDRRVLVLAADSPSSDGLAVGLALSLAADSMPARPAQT